MTSVTRAVAQSPNTCTPIGGGRERHGDRVYVSARSRGIDMWPPTRGVAEGEREREVDRERVIEREEREGERRERKRDNSTERDK